MESFEIFLLLNPSGRKMALGLTQPETEISARELSWGGIKTAGAYGRQPYHIYVLSEPPGALRDSFTSSSCTASLRA